MKKLVLIDGNNLMFRSFFATAYNGNLMKNSKGFPTNALYGFTSMINKIISEEKPEYIAVAFDVGKNFRKREYDFYKEGRAKTPDELKMQMPIARELLTAMGIKYLELEPYEADDIIGSLVKMALNDKEFNCTIISSDRDLLQLINYETDIKLLKQTGYIRYNEESFKADYGIDPINIIDLKALMGDSSDNIPGVKGIGEKGALKLLQEYKTLDGVYANIDNIKGATHDKLVQDKDNAYLSYKLATIYTDVPLDISLNDLKYSETNYDKLTNLYENLEFKSFLKNMDIPKKEVNFNIIKVNDEINVVLEDKVSLYLLLDNEIYPKANIIGACVCDSKYNYYFDKDNIHRLNNILKEKHVITYDHKKNLYLLGSFTNKYDDVMISSYLSLNVKDDIESIGSYFGYNLDKDSIIIKDNNMNALVAKTRFIYEVNDKLISLLSENNLLDLYRNIELPLIKVLCKMEKEGVYLDKEVLSNIGSEISLKIDEVSKEIYNLAGEEFNISSVKQLGYILFEKLEISKGKKNKTGYKTDAETLEKIIDFHPIIEKILEYRNLTKLRSTYIEGLLSSVYPDNLIHTIFKQTVARTGRLSSVEPNLQNIPVRDEYSRSIRKAFVPKNDLFLSSDYSQIELRILAHITGCKKMIDTFNSGGDIHAQVAADINGVDIKDVTPIMRKKAKSVIFGIVYGISGYGLMENLHITKKEADFFINKYYEMYPEVKKYMIDTENEAIKNGYVTTLFNRKRVIDELNSSNYMIREQGKRMAINTPIQGTSADIIKMAMIKIDEEFEKNNIQSKMLLQVHDELIFDIIKSEEEKVTSIVKDVMENIIKLDVPLKVSSDTGINWYDVK